MFVAVETRTWIVKGPGIDVLSADWNERSSLYPSNDAEPRTEPGHLFALLVGLTTLMIIEFVFHDGLVPCICIVGSIDGGRWTDIVHQSDREQRRRLALPREVHAVEVAQGFKNRSLLLAVLRQETDDLAIGVAHVVNAWQVLQKKVNLGSSVVVVDTRADWVAIGLSELLATEGHYVRLVTSDAVPGSMMQSYLRDQWLSELRKRHVSVTPNARLAAVDEDTAYLQDTFSGEYFEFESVNSIVTADISNRNASLESNLTEYNGRLHVIGDCLSPRSAEDAIYEGLEIGSRL